MESPVIKLKSKNIGGFEFEQIIMKLRNVQTNNKAASHINQVIKKINDARLKLHEEYMEQVVGKFAKRTETGEIDRTGGQPGDAGHFNIPDEVMEDFKKAVDEFGEKDVEINWRPLTPSCFDDLKVSAKEIDLLGPLYTEQEGPGVPQFSSVNNTVRPMKR